LVILSHNSFQVLFDKIAAMYFILSAQGDEGGGMSNILLARVAFDCSRRRRLNALADKPGSVTSLEDGNR